MASAGNWTDQKRHALILLTKYVHIHLNCTLTELGLELHNRNRRIDTTKFSSTISSFMNSSITTRNKTTRPRELPLDLNDLSDGVLSYLDSLGSSIPGYLKSIVEEVRSSANRASRVLDNTERSMEDDRKLLCEELAEIAMHWPVKRSAESVQIKSITNPKLWTDIPERIYRIRRWAAPNTKGSSPRLVEAYVQFYHQASKTTSRNARFAMAYRPSLQDDSDFSDRLFHARGIAMPIGEWLFLFGHESRENERIQESDPLVVACYVESQNSKSFSGLVLRRAERNGKFFVSRTRFDCMPKGTKMSDVEQRARLIPLNELTDKDLTELEKVRNIHLPEYLVRRRMIWNRQPDFGAEGSGSSGSSYAA